jgi:hypothetical protein
MFAWQLHLLVQLRQRFRQAIILLLLEITRSPLRVIIPNQLTLLLSEIMLHLHRVIMQSQCQQTQHQEATRSQLRVIIPNQLTLLLSEIIRHLHRVIMQSQCQQEIILHLHRVIIRSQVHQKNIRHQARQELIRHQAEVGTVVVVVLEVADQVHQATDHDK